MKYCKVEKEKVISVTMYVWKFVSMGMVHTARPYVICIIVNKTNLVNRLFLASLFPLQFPKKEGMLNIPGL